jgi:hypothetical protein
MEASWRKCLSEVEFATHYVAPEFFHEPPLPGLRSFAVLGLQHGEVAAVLTGSYDESCIRCGNAGRPQLVVSRRASQALVLDGLAHGLSKMAAVNSSSHIDIFAWNKFENLRAMGYMERAEKGVVMLDLSAGAGALFRQFSDNKKTNIKKAIKLGVTVEIATNPASWSEYYRIYEDWSQRKRLPFSDERHFLGLLSLTRNRKLFLARRAGKLLAGVIVRFVEGGVVEFSANSSLEEGLRFRPNDLLHWRVIEWACAGGFRIYSLAGSHMFLRKFGGSIHPTYRYRLDRTALRQYVLKDMSERAIDGLKRLLPESVRTAAKSVRDQVKRSASAMRRRAQHG